MTFVAWDRNKFNLCPFLTSAGILLEGHVRDGYLHIKLLNCYGKYNDKKMFWDSTLHSGILLEEDLIIGGDLNLTLEIGECWGLHAKLDDLAFYFKKFFQNLGLLDIWSGTLVPTWKNGRKGDHHIAKRLDRFMIKESLLSIFSCHKTWVVYSSISDHLPMVLELSSSSSKIKYPFKFNPVWLGNSSFDELVKKFGLSAWWTLLFPV